MAKQKSWNNYFEIINELGEGGNIMAQLSRRKFNIFIMN